MTLRLFAAAAAIACLSFAASAGAFFKLSLPVDWPQDAPPARACAAELALSTLEANLSETSLKVERIAGADAADYLAGVKALYDADLPAADLLVIVEVAPEEAADPDAAVEIVFGFKDGCLLFRVEAHEAAHRNILDWVKQHRTRGSARARRAGSAAS